MLIKFGMNSPLSGECSTYIAGRQYESLIAIKATIPSADDGLEGPQSL